MGRMTTDQSNPVKVYHSLWKNALLAIACFLFALSGWFLVTSSGTGWSEKVLIEIFGILFFGLGGIIITVLTIYQRFRRIPYLIIYDDRLEFYRQVQRKYYTINFSDVRKFRFYKWHSLHLIAVDYYKSAYRNKFMEASERKQRLMMFNANITGAVENIFANNLTMKGKEICNLLNARLDRGK